MRISHRWLTELLPGLAAPARQVADRLTGLGLLVEEVWSGAPGLERVVLGRVLSVEVHPSADRLKLCQVETAPGRTLRIVCGAPVVVEGAWYPVALAGATLPNGVRVEVSEIRGQRSEGMLCSAPELGLEHLGAAEGILQVDPGGLPAGAPIAPVLHLEDTIFVLEIPSNRPDWESHLGVARELQELAGERLRLPPGATPTAADGRPLEQPGARPHESRRAGGLTVHLLDAEGAPRYTGRIVRDLRVGPSPVGVRQRLHALGVRPINNVVDVTNYVMLELGTPLHAFDLARLAGNEVRVRRARPGERLVTLDGRERELDGGMTVIADRDRAVGLGGVMGGADSEVSDATREIFLEAGFFDPETIRRTAARLGLRTEASARFGRGVDPTAVLLGLERASFLLAEWAGGHAEPERFDLGGAPRARPVLSLRPERVQAVTGLSLDRASVTRALVGVDLPVEDEGRALRVSVPAHRFDLAREIDLVEEVARRAGYDRVPATPLPVPPRISGPGLADSLARLRETLRGLGLDEAVTPTFFDPAPFGSGFYGGRLVEQANPLAQNQPYLRPVLAATLVDAARHNLRRGAAGVAFYEFGHVFERAAGGGDADAGLGPPPGGVQRPGGDGRGGPETIAGGTGDAEGEGPRFLTEADLELPRLPGVDERRRLGLLLAGNPRPVHWSDGSRPGPADFYDLKGLVEALVGPERELAARPASRTWLHPGQQADLALEERAIGFLGRLHPRVERALDLAVPVLVADLDPWPFLADRRASRSEPISPFPRIERDLALVVPDVLSAAEAADRIRRAAPENLVELRLFDVYRGDPVPAGSRSLAFRLVFQSVERTLTEAEIDRGLQGLVASLSAAGIRLR